MGKRDITAVYIRGLAFKATAGGRRQQVLNQLKAADEKGNDLWLLKYLSVAALAFAIGGWIGSIWPLA